jgi:hypothetical protein
MLILITYGRGPVKSADGPHRARCKGGLLLEAGIEDFDVQ